VLSCVINGLIISRVQVRLLHGRRPRTRLPTFLTSLSLSSRRFEHLFVIVIPSYPFALTPPRGWIKILANTFVGFAYLTVVISHSHSHSYTHFYFTLAFTYAHTLTYTLIDSSHPPSTKSRCSLVDTRQSRWGLTLCRTSRLSEKYSVCAYSGPGSTISCGSLPNCFPSTSNCPLSKS
jgi:hypothetical protein